MASLLLLEFIARHTPVDKVFYKVPDIFLRILRRIFTFYPQLFHNIIKGVFAVKSFEDEYAYRVKPECIAGIRIKENCSVIKLLSEHQ
jgi:hypothetical protein